MKFIILLLIILMQFIVIPPPKAQATTSRVNLLTTDNFAVLGGSAISDTVTTSVIIGDVGLRAGAGITGLKCSEVTGSIYDGDVGYTGNGGGSTACRVTNDSLLIQAQNDLGTAYIEAFNRTAAPDIGTDLAGVILTDGIYHAASDTFVISGGGTLTLDGQGNADSVFIFKMGTSLTTSTSSRVVLTNGAQACNVYWQVGSQATLGDHTSFVGNILALSAIIDNGGSSVNGRLLARTAGAVTLNNTRVTKQTCSAGTAGGPALAANSSSSSNSSSDGSSSTVYPILNYVAPRIIDSKRIDADSVFISWGPYSGTDKFIVQYGLENGKWMYNINVTGFSTTINALPSNQPIWVQIAARDSNSIASYGEVKLVGGPSLPNTGFAPQEINNLRYIPGRYLGGDFSSPFIN